jgi:hypothetical protein
LVARRVKEGEAAARRRGSARNPNEVVTWFIDAPMPVAYHDGQLLEFSPLEPHHMTSGNSVVASINGASFSESELFAEKMRQIPPVTVVGGTTGAVHAVVETAVRARRTRGFVRPLRR